MNSSPSGSFRLFRVAGIQVFLHWSWLLVAWYQIASRGRAYTSVGWNVAEYLGLFLIVLLHEFGHAFASRQVGGEAKEILLWPFGGIAFVKVPPRPGAELWSIAAGPLVNVALIPVLAAMFWLSLPVEIPKLLWNSTSFFRMVGGFSDQAQFLGTIYHINLWLLYFNLLPIYPLDGGQMLRSLLWFRLGRALSLQVASIVGFAGIAGLVGLAISTGSIFSGLIALFLGQQCFAGWRQARALRALERVPRHAGFACPSCRQAPPGGPLWLCASCGNRFDPFSTGAVCPHCQAAQAATPCAHCGASHPLESWRPAAARRGDPPVIDV